MNLSDKVIRSLSRGEYTDSKTTGLVVRITRKGAKSFYQLYRISSRRKRFRIGSASIGIRAARLASKKIMARVSLGEDPQEIRVQERDANRKKKTGTLRSFLDQRYYPYAEQTQRSADYTRRLIETNFGWLMNKQMSAVTFVEVDRWQTDKLASGLKPQTINRRMTAIRACFNRAVEWGVIDVSPFNGKRKLKTEKTSVVRWLSDDEKDRLLRVLDEQSHTYLTTIVYALYFTGARPKEIKSLKWSAVDFDARQLTLHAAFCKTNQTRIVPMNDTLYNVMREWRKVCNQSSEWLFPSPNSDGYVRDIGHVWRRLRDDAGIKDFRMYDLRHSCASHLCMKGVSIYLISKLLGHSSVNTTQIYAHASDESISEIVGLLD